MIKLTVEKNKSKSTCFYVTVFYLLVQAVNYFFYINTLDFSSEIDQLDSFIFCKAHQTKKGYYFKIDHKHMGEEYTFLKTYNFSSLIAMIFAMGYLWRQLKNPFWYETTRKNKIKMTLISEAVVLILWILIFIFGPSDIKDCTTKFILFGIISLVLNMTVFLILPLLFIRFGLTNEK